MANPRHHTLLGVLLPLLLALAPSLAAGTSILPVSDGPALVAALGLSELPDIILLTGNISLSRSLWPLLAPITISSDVILQGASGGTYVSLDFNCGRMGGAASVRISYVTYAVGGTHSVWRTQSATLMRGHAGPASCHAWERLSVHCSCKRHFSLTAFLPCSFMSLSCV